MNTWNVWLGAWLLVCVGLAFYGRWECAGFDQMLSRDEAGERAMHFLIARAVLAFVFILAVKLIWFWK